MVDMRMAGIKFPNARKQVGIGVLLTNLFWLVLSSESAAEGAALPEVTASSSQVGFTAAGVIDGKRFSFATNHAWKGVAGASNWWWGIEFSKTSVVCAILTIHSVL